MSRSLRILSRSLTQIPYSQRSRGSNNSQENKFPHTSAHFLPLLILMTMNLLTKDEDNIKHPQTPPTVINTVTAPDLFEQKAILHEMSKILTHERPVSSELSVRNLVLKGGGPKGIAYGKALKVLSERLGGLEGIWRVAGASAGSIVATLLAVGYDADEILDMLEEKVPFKDRAVSVITRFALDDDDDPYTVDFIAKLGELDSKWSSQKIQFAKILSYDMITHPAFYFQLMQKFYYQRALCSGNYFRGWINEKISTKVIEYELNKLNIIDPIVRQRVKAELEFKYTNLTFEQLAQLISEDEQQYGRHYKHLYVVVAEKKHRMVNGEKKLSLSHHVYTSEQLPINPNRHTKYGNRTIIADTIRASMSIPFFFKEVPLFEKDKGKIKPVGLPTCIDGGTLNNYPYRLFDFNLFQSTPNLSLHPDHPLDNSETLGLRLMGEDKIEESSFISWFRESAEIKDFVYQDDDMIDPENKTIHYQSSDEDPRHIEIDDRGVSLLAFNMTPKDKEALLDSGELSVVNYFSAREHKANRLQQAILQTIGNHQTILDTEKKCSEMKLDSLILSNFVIPMQYYQLLKNMTTVQTTKYKEGNVDLSFGSVLFLSGMTKTGKTYLAHYLALRYREACLWGQWWNKKTVRAPSFVWYLSARDPEILWRSVQDLAKKLRVNANLIPKLNQSPDESQGKEAFEKKQKHAIEKFFKAISEELEQLKYTLLIFDDAQSRLTQDVDEKLKEIPNTILFPALGDYLQLLKTKNGWMVLTSENHNLLSSLQQATTYSESMNPGIGRGNAVTLFKRCIRSTSMKVSSDQKEIDDQEIFRQTQLVGNLPWDIMLVTNIICQEGISSFLEEQKKPSFSKKLAAILEDDISNPSKVERLIRPELIERSLHNLQKFPNGKEAYRLLKFCSLLDPNRIDQSLLLAFTRQSYSHLNSCEQEEKLRVQLKLLKQYSLIEGNGNQYHMIGLLQTTTLGNVADDEKTENTLTTDYCLNQAITLFGQLFSCLVTENNERKVLTEMRPLFPHVSNLLFNIIPSRSFVLDTAQALKLALLWNSLARFYYREKWDHRNALQCLERFGQILETQLDKELLGAYQAERFDDSKRQAISSSQIELLTLYAREFLYQKGDCSSQIGNDEKAMQNAAVNLYTSYRIQSRLPYPQAIPMAYTLRSLIRNQRKQREYDIGLLPDDLKDLKPEQNKIYVKKNGDLLKYCISDDNQKLVWGEITNHEFKDMPDYWDEDQLRLSLPKILRITAKHGKTQLHLPNKIIENLSILNTLIQQNAQQLPELVVAELTVDMGITLTEQEDYKPDDDKVKDFGPAIAKLESTKQIYLKYNKDNKQNTNLAILSLHLGDAYCKHKDISNGMTHYFSVLIYLQEVTVHHARIYYKIADEMIKKGHFCIAKFYKDQIPPLHEKFLIRQRYKDRVNKLESKIAAGLETKEVKLVKNEKASQYAEFNPQEHHQALLEKVKTEKPLTEEDLNQFNILLCNYYQSKKALTLVRPNSDRPFINSGSGPNAEYLLANSFLVTRSQKLIQTPSSQEKGVTSNMFHRSKL